MRLDVHLENHHTVYFKEGEQDRAMIRSKPGTTITEWFTANHKWPAAAHIKCHRFPRHFIWNKGDKS